jgi:hypothetical protein
MAESAKVLLNGVEFHAGFRSLWRIAATGEMKDNLTLSFTNRSAKAVRFWLFDTLRVELRDSSDAPALIGGGRNRTKPGTLLSPLVPPAHSFSLTRRLVLHRTTPTQFSLVGEDGFGGNWTATNLTPGKYRLILHYRHVGDGSPQSSDCWQGEAQTPPLTFEIR